MAVKPIRLFGDPVLTTPAAAVETFDKELRKLVKDLTDTMLEAPGSGLAAPQLGVSLRVFTYDVDDEIGHLINPTLDLSDDMVEGDEGCLSVPNLAFNTRRSRRVVAKGMNMWGEPVVGYVAGLTAPKGRKMGHAGAIISGAGDSAAEKSEIMKSFGLTVSPSPSDFGTTMAKVLKKAA